MKFTYICENCRREVRYQATVVQYKQLIKTLAMSFPCPECDATLLVQMCDDGTTVVSISGEDSPIAGSSSQRAADSGTGFSQDPVLRTAPRSVADSPDRSRAVNSPAPQPPPPAGVKNATPIEPGSDQMRAVTGHVPFELLDEVPKERRANTGVPLLDSLINDPPTTTQVILGISLIFAAVVVYLYDPGEKASAIPSGTPEANAKQTATIEHIDGDDSPAAPASDSSPNALDEDAGKGKTETEVGGAIESVEPDPLAISSEN